MHASSSNEPSTLSTRVPRGFWNCGGGYTVLDFQTSAHATLTEHGWEVELDNDGTLWKIFPVDQKERAMAMAEELAERFGIARFMKDVEDHPTCCYDDHWDCE